MGLASAFGGARLQTSAGIPGTQYLFSCSIIFPAQRADAHCDRPARPRVGIIPVDVSRMKKAGTAFHNQPASYGGPADPMSHIPVTQHATNCSPGCHIHKSNSAHIRVNILGSDLELPHFSLNRVISGSADDGEEALLPDVGTALAARPLAGELIGSFGFEASDRT